MQFLSGATARHGLGDLSVLESAAHSSVMTTQLCAHSTDEARRAAMDRLSVTVAPSSNVRVLVPRRRDTNRDTKATTEQSQVLETMVGHLGLEPRANGLRVRCSTN